MKPTKEQLEAYKKMASSSQGTMCDIIKAHLVENCQKYDEALFDRCIQHLYDTVLEMLGGQEAAVDNKLSGNVPADTCFRICSDYYNDEIWKKEDEEAEDMDPTPEAKDAVNKWIKTFKPRFNKVKEAA